uniref:Potassium channel domain-containing protein n=1 Tax=Plectus sambesii TaxID=2011161 RepID=A0A914X5U1_9BILA
MAPTATLITVLAPYSDDRPAPQPRFPAFPSRGMTFAESDLLTLSSARRFPPFHSNLHDNQRIAVGLDLLVSTVNLDGNLTMVLPNAGDLNGQTNNNYYKDDEEDEDDIASSPSTRRHSSHTAQTHSHASKLWKKISVGPSSTATSTDRQRRLHLLERYFKQHDNYAAMKLAVENLQTHPFDFRLEVNEDQIITPKKRRRWRTFFHHVAYLHKKFGLRHIFLLLLLIGYALIGGAIFDAIERSNEIEDLQGAHQVLLHRIGNVSEEIISIVSAVNGTHPQAEVESIVKDFYKDMLDLEGKLKNSVFDKVDHERLVWDFGSAVFYASTLFTTIGYGTIACATAWGKAISIVYSIIGIPLMLVVLNDVGRVLFFALQKLYNRVYQLCRRTRLCRKVDENDTVDHTFPLRLAVPLVFVYMLLCAVVIHVFDNELRGEDEGGLSFGDSFYFAFISLSTIGLGDIMPNNIQYSPFVAALFLFGLTLLSVINSTLYVRMERHYFRAMEAMEEVLEELHAEEVDENVRGHKVFKNMSDAIRIATLTLPGNIVTTRSSERNSVSSTPHHSRRQSTTRETDSPMPTLGAMGFNLAALHKYSQKNEPQEMPTLDNNHILSHSDTNLFLVRSPQPRVPSSRALHLFRRIHPELPAYHTVS